MSTPLLIAVTFAYLWTAVEQLYDQHYGFGVMFLAYAIAQVGLIYHVKYESVA